MIRDRRDVEMWLVSWLGGTEAACEYDIPAMVDHLMEVCTFEDGKFLITLPNLAAVMEAHAL